MAEVNPEAGVVNARIVFWGIGGSGKTANLQAIFANLRPDHRGEMREIPTPFDPTVCYEELPIELGEIAGVRTLIQLVTVPSEPEQGPTRKQILDEVDGIVLVLDSQRERIDENVACVQELRKHLADYGRTLSDMPFVVEYNKRDLADPYFLEELHRKLDLGGAAVFETVATERTGVLQALSTISKRVIRTLRERRPEEKPEPAAFAPVKPEVDDLPPTVIERPAFDYEPAAEPAEAAAPAAPPPAAPAPAEPAPSDLSPSDRMEAAIRYEAEHPELETIEAAAHHAETQLNTSWERVADELEQSGGVRMGPDLSIVSVGEATRSGERAVRVPLVLGDGDGNTSTLLLTIQLDPLTDED
jgi:signal recognition particle receptor subunit beta